MTDDAKDRVRRQYGSVGDAYVRSAGHASGDNLKRMVKLASLIGTERVLDIATGGGHVARSFAPHVASVVASDLTPEILQYAESAFREWGLDNVHTAVADAEALPFAGASFEIVTCRIAPHHFPHPGSFVAEVARVLVPGGRLLLVDSTVPEGQAGEWFNQIEAIRDPSHVRSLSVAEWSALIAESGLQVLASEHFRKTHDFADWVTRSRTSDHDRERLERQFLLADAVSTSLFDIRVEDDRVLSFTDTKSLFAAKKPT